MDGKVLIAGGDVGDGDGASVIAELFDPAIGVFSRTGNLTQGREQHTATLLPDGTVLFAGGHSNPSVAARFELYDPVRRPRRRCPQHWMIQAMLDAVPNAPAGEILHFLESKIDSGWRAANWQAYPAVVRHEFERRNNRAQGKQWSNSDLATVRTVITRYMEGEEPPIRFEHSCELRANGATLRDVVGLLERRWKNPKYRRGAKHGPGAVGGKRRRWNWFLKVIGNEFSETERAHLPEPPVRAKKRGVNARQRTER